MMHKDQHRIGNVNDVLFSIISRMKNVICAIVSKIHDLDFFVFDLIMKPIQSIVWLYSRFFSSVKTFISYKKKGAMASRTNNGTNASNDGQSDTHIPSQYEVLTISFNQDCTYRYTIFSLQNQLNLHVLEHWLWAL